MNVGLLRDHISELNKEKKIAQELYDNVMAAKRLSDPSESYKYNRVLNEIEQLIEYFAKMADVLRNVEFEAGQLSQKIGATIEDDTARAKHAISNAITL